MPDQSLSSQSESLAHVVEPERWASRVRELNAEVKRLRKLAQQVLDALDAEKTPDFGVGHDRAVEAAVAMLGQRMKPIEGRNVPLSEL